MAATILRRPYRSTIERQAPPPLVVTVIGWILVRPMFVSPIASLTAKVSR